MEETLLPGSEQVTFRGFTPPDSAAEVIRERIHALASYAPDIVSCRVAVEMPHRHHEHGNLYHVRIATRVPGDEIVVSHQPTRHAEERDLQESAHHKATELAAVDRNLYTAIHDAFDMARRQLQDHVRRSRGKTKRHEAPPHGRIARLFRTEGYGFIMTSDDREVYFHENAVLGGAFAKLEVGSNVGFVEEEGDKGPQASTVRLLGKHLG